MVLLRASLVLQQDSCYPVRIHLEDRRLASGTTNVRLTAVRRLADEATAAGLLSPEFAAGIRRVKGSKRLGVRLGNWLTAEQARSLWQLPSAGTLKSKRDRAIVAVLLGCGLRRRPGTLIFPSAGHLGIGGKLCAFWYLVLMFNIPCPLLLHMR